MKVVIKSYPCSVQFHTATKFPPFKYGCPVRSNEARIAIEAKGYDAPHHPSDFIVEEVKQRPYGEEWEMGS